MLEAPEGLKYGTDNDKYAKTPLNMDYKQKGKIETGSHESLESINKAAEKLRMNGCCSHDPMYKNSKKNW